jgi:hypothetical protein
MSSYAQELEFFSPKIRVILGENKNNTIGSKRELSTYVSAGLERYPNLKFNRKIRVRKRTCVKKSGAYYGVEQTTH